MGLFFISPAGAARMPVIRNPLSALPSHGEDPDQVGGQRIAGKIVFYSILLGKQRT